MACGVRGDIPWVAWCPPLGHLAGERHPRLDSAVEHRSQALRLDPHRWGRRSKSQPYCAINLGVATDRIDTVVDCRAAKEKGVKSRGTTGAGGAGTGHPRRYRRPAHPHRRNASTHCRARRLSGLGRPQGSRAHRAAPPRSRLNYPRPTSAHAASRAFVNCWRAKGNRIG